MPPPLRVVSERLTADDIERVDEAPGGNDAPRGVVRRVRPAAVGGLTVTGDPTPPSGVSRPAEMTFAGPTRAGVMNYAVGPGDTLGATGVIDTRETGVAAPPSTPASPAAGLPVLADPTRRRRRFVDLWRLVFARRRCGRHRPDTVTDLSWSMFAPQRRARRRGLR